MTPRYDTIGENYADHRRTDPRIAQRIVRALGDARSILNLGAGTGSYEPVDRPVVPVEPSHVMARQRPPDRPGAVLARAEDVPFLEDSFDAVLAVLTIHHWTDPHAGVLEAIRVARRRVVILTVDPLVEAEMWLFRDYVPEIAARDRQEFPSLAQLREWLPPATEAEPVPVPRDCTDGFLLSFWGRPEALLDPRARQATSGFARLDDRREAAAIQRLSEDLKSGAWDRRHGDHRSREEYDAGLRLLVAEL